MDSIKKALIISIVVGFGISEIVLAKVRSIGSQREFEHHVANQGICVVLFYDGGDKKDSDMREKNKQLQRMLEDVSAQQLYDNADVVFIKINSARKEFKIILDQYGITKVPCFMLFCDGKHIKNEQNESCLLHGFITREQLESMLDSYCGQEIKRLNDAKLARQKKVIDEEKSSWLPYFYPRDIFVRDYDPAQRLME